MIDYFYVSKKVPLLDSIVQRDRANAGKHSHPPSFHTGASVEAPDAGSVEGRDVPELARAGVRARDAVSLTLALRPALRLFLFLAQTLG